MHTKATLALTACLTLGSCALQGQLFFFTSTTVGVDVSADPASGTPKASLGYKRLEGTIFPVRNPGKKTTTGSGDNQTTVEEPRDLVKEAFSVIAKYSGAANAGKDTGMSNSQWFATGQAAKILARQPGIAGAVSGSAKIAEAAAKEAAFGSGLGIEGRRLAFHAVELAYKMLQAIENDPKNPAQKAKAKELLAGLNKAAEGVPSMLDFTRFGSNRYKWIEDGQSPLRSVLFRFAPSTLKKGLSGFELAIEYRKTLTTSIAFLDKATTEKSDYVYWTTPEGASKIKDTIKLEELLQAGALTQINKNDFKNLLSSQNNHLATFDRIVTSHPSVIAALKYANRLFEGRD